MGPRIDADTAQTPHHKSARGGGTRRPPPLASQKGSAMNELAQLGWPGALVIIAAICAVAYVIVHGDIF